MNVYFVDALPIASGRFEIYPTQPDQLWSAWMGTDSSFVSRLRNWWVESALAKNLPHLDCTKPQPLPSPLPDGQEFVVVVEGHDADHVALWRATYHTPVPEPKPITDKDEADEIVYMIASGYEWGCLDCGHENREMGYTLKVRCADCGRVFLAEVGS